MDQAEYDRSRLVSKRINQFLQECKQRGWIRKSDRSLLLLLIKGFEPNLKTCTRSYREMMRLYYCGRYDWDSDEFVVTPSMRVGFSRLINRIERGGYIRRFSMGRRLHLCLTSVGRDKMLWCYREYSGEIQECFTYRFFPDKLDTQSPVETHPRTFDRLYLMD